MGSDTDAYTIDPRGLTGVILRELCYVLRRSGLTAQADRFDQAAGLPIDELLYEIDSSEALNHCLKRTVQARTRQSARVTLPQSHFIRGAHRRAQAWAQEETARVIKARAVLWEHLEPPVDLERVIVRIAIVREYIAVTESREAIAAQAQALYQASGDSGLTEKAWMNSGAASFDIWAAHASW